MKKIVIGVLAHVDAGKTTLSESILYLTKTIRSLGRVDNGNTLLDYNNQEKKRGITIFLAQSQFDYQNTKFVWVDTPGHIDFSTEMERTLKVLDYAIIVINGLDGVQAHTLTIWNLLKHYHIPCFIFVNKMDITHLSKEELMNNIQHHFHDQCLDFSLSLDSFYESLAMCSDNLLNNYMENQVIDLKLIQEEIKNRHVFPCFFGSALKLEGIEELLQGIDTYSLNHEYPQEFGAIVYKVTRDGHDRLTHVKITGGSLKTKMNVSDKEKVDQIRIYSGHKYQVVDEVFAGDVCALKGLKKIQVGDALGIEKSHSSPLLSSYMNYQVILPLGCDTFMMLAHLRQLAEEDPELHVTYNESLKEIRIQLMGEIQIEILKNVIKERFDVDVEFDQGHIIYKETIEDTVEGVGHYEPLRHYAEVHLLLEPGTRGSGLQFLSDCKEDVLDRHYQRLILSHLVEKEHLGVLTGSPITDMKITLLTGKAHLKHTEGGDFRQATYRAIRQGLKLAKSVILEPYYSFSLEIPQEYMSKAIYDIESMHGSFILPENITDTIIIKGSAPVKDMQSYQTDVISYTKGKGKLICTLEGYEVCYNQDEIIQDINYDSETDMDNPTGSIFCAHGAGFNVKWDKVKDYMHIPFQYKIKPVETIVEKYSSSLEGDDELEHIFTQTYGPIEHRLASSISHKRSNATSEYVKPLPECLLVDGYNVIHAWPELKELVDDHMDVARERLIDIMSNYQGYKQCLLILVFDAYKVKQNQGTVHQHHNISVVYTKEAQTADMYIEKVTRDLLVDYNVVVATSDALEQLIVGGAGARRMSSRELKLEVEALSHEKKTEFERKQKKSRNFLLEDVKNYKD